jgi:hypothetical protein
MAKESKSPGWIREGALWRMKVTDNYFQNDEELV